MRLIDQGSFYEMDGLKMKKQVLLLGLMGIFFIPPMQETLGRIGQKG